MIAFLRGTVQGILGDALILNVNGVGYHVHIPLPARSTLAEACEVDLWIYTRVREDAIQLYGFASMSERQIFSLLIDISGVGPKVALALLSAYSVDELREIVERQQVEMLQNVPGIGKRMADKLLLELQAKLSKFPALGTQPATAEVRQGFQAELALKKQAKARSLSLAMQQDLQSALENLGYRERDIAPVLKQCKLEYQGQQLQELLRQALIFIGSTSKVRRGEGESEILF